MGKIQNMNNEEYVNSDLVEDLNYIQNVWNPGLGHHVFNVETGTKHKIASVVEKYEEQLFLEDFKEVVFLQDVTWYPEQPEIEEHLSSFGFVLTGDSIYYKGLSLAKPTDIPSFANSIRTTRHYAQLKNLPDPIFPS
jgi:hypothetical protein